MTEWTAASGARNVSRKNNWWVSDGNGRAAETSNGRLRTFKTIESARKAAVALNLAEQRRVTEEWNARLLAEDNRIEQFRCPPSVFGGFNARSKY